MRILHFSDLHIGIENYGRTLTEADLEGLPAHFAPGEDRKQYLGQSTRIVDFLCAFDELVDFALNNEVDLVLFSGDAYKNREPTQTHQREFAKRILRLSSAGVPVFLLVGNHDLPHAGYKASALEIFDVMGIPRVTVGDRLAAYHLESRRGPVQVLALPWIRRSAFLNRDDTRNLPFDQTNRLIERRLTEILAARSADLDPGIPSLLSAHVSLTTARLGTERTMTLGRDYTLLQSNLTGMPVDYIGLGHIHLPQKLSETPPMTYSGSLQRVDFGEEDHEAKGFWVVDVDPKRPVRSRVTGLEFHAVQARSFVTIDVAVTEADLDPTGVVVRAIGRHHVTGAVVRVSVAVPASMETFIQEHEIRKALEDYGAHTIAAVTRVVARTQRTRLGGVYLESKSPQEALRLYWQSAQVTTERADQLALYADRLMHAEDAEEEEP